MRKLHRFVIAAAVTTALAPIALPSTAMAQGAVSQTGLYAGLGAGLDSMPDRSLDINGFHVTSKWKSGWGVLAAVGYKWDFGLRTEIEYSYREAHVRAFNTNPWSGTQWDNSLFANALYDFNLGAGFMPFIGGGIGGAHISWGDNFRAASPVIYDASGNKFGWQGIIGLGYAISPRFTVTLDGRIKGSSGYSFHGSAPGTLIKNFDYITHSLFLGFRYALD